MTSLKETCKLVNSCMAWPASKRHRRTAAVAESVLLPDSKLNAFIIWACNHSALYPILTIFMHDQDIQGGCVGFSGHAIPVPVGIRCNIQPRRLSFSICELDKVLVWHRHLLRDFVNERSAECHLLFPERGMSTSG